MAPCGSARETLGICELACLVQSCIFEVDILGNQLRTIGGSSKLLEEKLLVHHSHQERVHA